MLQILLEMDNRRRDQRRARTEMIKRSSTG